MKTSGFMAVLLLGLAVCACLVRLHGRRVPAPPAASVVAAPGTNDRRPVDARQWSITLTLRGDDSPDTRRLIEKLRREEERQRPEEGRN